MDDNNSNLDEALQGVDVKRREAMRRFIVKGAIIAPIVASFALASLTTQAAAASGQTPA